MRLVMTREPGHTFWYWTVSNIYGDVIADGSSAFRWNGRLAAKSAVRKARRNATKKVGPVQRYERRI